MRRDSGGFMVPCTNSADSPRPVGRRRGEAARADRGGLPFYHHKLAFAPAASTKLGIGCPVAPA